MSDKITAESLAARGTSMMVALSTYAQACLAFAAVRDGGHYFVGWGYDASGLDMTVTPGSY